MGHVVQIISPSVATVDYLQLVTNNFKWPLKKDIADVESKFIIASGLEIAPEDGTFDFGNYSALSWKI